MKMDPIRRYALRILIVLTCLAAFVPYVLPAKWMYTKVAEKQWEPNFAMDYLGPGLWLALLLATLIVGRWQRNLFWLLALFPVAFGYWIFYGFFVLDIWLRGGFAP